jgi:hypothetical protein
MTDEDNARRLVDELIAKANELNEHFKFDASNSNDALDAMRSIMSEIYGRPLVCRWEGDVISCQPAFHY